MSIYSQVNHWDFDDEFRLVTVKNLKPRVVADLGCGNGRMTFPIREFTDTVFGIDPDSEAIIEAKNEDKHSKITWINGTSEELKLVEHNIDTITMLTNVSQEITDSKDWLRTLQDCYNALNEGGTLIFDGRNFYQKGWLGWTKENTLQEITLENGQAAKHWHQFYAVENNLVRFNTVIESKSDKEVFDSRIIFRTKDDTIKDLMSVGFKKVIVYGDWKSEIAHDNHKEFLFIASK